MLNSRSLAHFEKARWTPHFNRPIYDSYSFSLIPETITRLLTGEGGLVLPSDTIGREKYDCVVLFFVDGFGWQSFERFFDRLPFLNRFSEEGIASKISSQFPSTTAAHVTTINTGQEVGSTGIYEWFYYEPKVQELITPLLFSYAGDHVPNTLSKKGVNPQEIFPFETFYEKLNRKGVKSIVMQEEGIAHSPYSQTLLKGAHNLPYVHFEQALQRIKQICEGPRDAPTYIFVYFSDIDSAGHRRGIDSPEFETTAVGFWNTIEREFWQKVTPQGKTAFLFTADHGMAPVDPQETVYINRIFPEITDFLQETASGKKCVPAGSCRDFFLHCFPERVEELQSILQKKLNGKADVVQVDRLLKEGFFGKEIPSRRLEERIGNLVILPYLKESVWWFEKHRFEQHFWGAHGGLTPAEMETIFLFCEK